MPSISNSSPQPARHFLSFPAGLPLSFEWTADASSYGGVVVGYRYGWDVEDVDDDSDWDVTLTPFVGSYAKSEPRAFGPGTHRFLVEVTDNAGLKSRAEVVVNFIAFTMEKPLLLIDDVREGATNFAASMGATPGDAEHDAFWEFVLDEVAGFSPTADVLHLERDADDVPLELISRYQTVVWNARGTPGLKSSSRLGDFMAYVSDDPELADPSGQIKPNVLDLFVESGGKILLCGSHVMSNAINYEYFAGRGAVFPMIFRYELEGDQDGIYEASEVGVRGVADLSFAYESCCLNTVDVATSANIGIVRRAGGENGAQACPVKRERSHAARTQGLRACSPLDGTYPFPRLELRPEVSDPGRWYHESRIGLTSDLYNPDYFGLLCDQTAESLPLPSCFQPIYGLECLDTESPIYGAPVAFWSTPRSDPQAGPRSAVMGFDPVYFRPAQVKEAVGIVVFSEWGLQRK